MIWPGNLVLSMRTKSVKKTNSIYLSIYSVRWFTRLARRWSGNYTTWVRREGCQYRKMVSPGLWYQWDSHISMVSPCDGTPSIMSLGRKIVGSFLHRNFGEVGTLVGVLSCVCGCSVCYRVSMVSDCVGEGWTRDWWLLSVTHLKATRHGYSEEQFSVNRTALHGGTISFSCDLSGLTYAKSQKWVVGSVSKYRDNRHWIGLSRPIKEWSLSLLGSSPFRLITTNTPIALVSLWGSI